MCRAIEKKILHLVQYCREYNVHKYHSAKQNQKTITQSIDNHQNHSFFFFFASSCSLIYFLLASSKCNNNIAWVHFIYLPPLG